MDQLRKRPFPNKQKVRLTKAQKDRIAFELWTGRSVKAIAIDHNISGTTVHHILHQYFKWVLVRK